MSILTPSEYQTFLRQDFCTFIQRSFHELNPQTTFLMNWHVEVLAAKLEACRQGKIKRLIINIPPRYLKSISASVALPAFWLGHDPSAQIICVSYGQELSDKLARDCRAIMNTGWYQSVFPTRLSGEKQSVQEFATTENGFRLATSVGGALTGRGGDVIIIDDPLKPDEALSDPQRNKCNEWFSNTLRSRLNDKQNGCIILIMQRLHEDDLVGHVLGQEDWDVVRFPAIAEEAEEHTIETVFGSRRFKREVGDVLHPERESKETLDRICKTMGEYNFAGQYQQAPAPFGGGMVKEAWFKRYAPNDLPDHFDQIVQSWDTANKPTELSDFSVCTTWGIKDQHIFLLNVLRKRMAYPDLKRAVKELWQSYKPSVILIEDKASGTQLIQELIEDRIYAVTRFKPEFDKIMRLNAQTGTIENGFVYLPQEAHWLADYLHELTTFPASKFNDQVDSTSQALAWTKARPAGWGLLEYMRRESEKLNPSSTGIMVKLKAPNGSSHVQTITGHTIAASADGTFLVSEEDARPLVGAGFQRV